jgi:uncharacterized protein YbjT (DUF2867 family)
MVEAFRGTDTLILVPGMSPPPERVVQHQNALEAAREAGVGRVVLSSFMGGAPESPFVVSPFTVYSESSLRTSGLAWTILRNGMYSDPLVPYVPELVAMGRIPYPAGTGRISYVSRDDLARATAAAGLDSRHAGKVYTLTGPEALSIDRVAEIVTLVTGKPVRYESATDEEFTAMCEMPGAPPYLARALTTLYHAAAQGFLEDVTDHIETLTGTPPEDLESFLRRSL